MNDEQAATKIQKTFRGHSSRKKLKKEKQSVIKIQKVYRGHHTRRIIAKQEQSALKIQKVFRGHVERKKFLKVRPKVIILKEEPASDVGTTLAIIKPDAVAKGLSDAIKLRIRDEGFTIVQEKLIQLNRTSAEEFYAEHYGKPFFERLTTFMSSGPVRVLILSRANAIKAWRQLMGPTNVTTAKQQAPTSLRALFGNESESTNNAVHGSDSEASAQREIHFFFPTQPVFNTTREQGKEFINAKVVPLLTEGLANLCKQKPAEPILWLANWLLTNNPNKPKVVEV